MTTLAPPVSRARRAVPPFMGVLDAGMSSVGNLVVAIVAARQLDLQGFGLFSTTMFLGLIVMGMWRAMHVEPLVLCYSAAAVEDRHLASRTAFGASLVLVVVAAPLLGLVSVGISVAAGADLAEAASLAAALVLVVPALVGQDFLRYASYAHQRPGLAVLNTSLWTSALVLGLVLLSMNDPAPSTSRYVLVWGSSALVGVVAGMIGLALVPRWGHARTWHRQHRQMIRRLLSDWGLLQVTAEGSTLILATLGGASAVGLLRKAQIPLAPIPVVTNGASAVLQPWFVRLLGRGGGLRELRRVAWMSGSVLSVTSCVGGLVIYLLPPAWLAQAVGPEWTDARALVPWLTVYLACGALAACLGVALRAAGYLREQVRVRQAMLPLTLGLVVVGCLTGGALGAAIALTTSVALVVVAWAWLLQHAVVSAPRPGA